MIVTTLLCKRDMAMALMTLPTIVSAIPDLVGIRVISDGTLDRDDEAELRSRVDTYVEVLLSQELDEIVYCYLSDYPKTRQYRDAHPLGRKFVDSSIMAIKRCEQHLLFIDSDVVFGRPIIFAMPEDVDAIFMIQENRPVLEGFGLWWSDLGRLLLALGPHRRILSGLNAGVWMQRTESMSFDVVERFFSLVSIAHQPRFYDQAIPAVMLSPHRVGAMDPRLCICPKDSRRRDIDERCMMVHCLGRSKHDEEFMTYVQGLVRDGSGGAVQSVPIIHPWPECRAIAEALLTSCWRSLRRMVKT